MSLQHNSYPPSVQVCEDKEIKVPKLVCGEVKEADAEDI